MIMDKQGKLFGKISVVDIIIVLVLVACLVAAAIRFSGGISDISAKNVEIVYTYELKSVRAASIAALGKRGSVYKKSAGEDFMGTIVSIDPVPNKDYALKANGEFVETSSPERYDVVVTIKVSGKQSGTSLYTSTNQKIEAGSNLMLSTKWIGCIGDITSVTVME